MIARTKGAGVTVAAILSAVRILLGVLWIHEGIFKYTAHFGAADILLVADSAHSNSRVPAYFAVFADHTLGQWPGLFGFAMPLLETTLGILLILGLFTLPAALASLLTLMLYWSSDQLIAQYPVMGALSAVVIAFPVFATRISLTTAILARMSRHGTPGPGLE